MKFPNKPFQVVIAASGGVLAVSFFAFFAVASATNGASPQTAACPDSCYPLANQPHAIQQQCSALKEQGLQSYEATAAAGPHMNNALPAISPTALGNDHIFDIPPEMRLIQTVDGSDVFQGYSVHASPTSAVFRPNLIVAGLVLVTLATSPSPGSLVRQGLSRSLRTLGLTARWKCPRESEALAHRKLGLDPPAECQ